MDINSRPLGDVPYSMGIDGSRIYIIVNNSGKIEVAGMNDMRSVTTISKIASPRYISFITWIEGLCYEPLFRFGYHS